MGVDYAGHFTVTNFKLGTSFHPFRKRSSVFNLLYLNQLLLMGTLALRVYFPHFIDLS